MRGYVWVVVREHHSLDEGSAVAGVEVFERKGDAEGAAGTWARSAGGRVKRRGSLWFGYPPERGGEPVDGDSADHRDAMVIRRTVR